MRKSGLALLCAAALAYGGIAVESFEADFDQKVRNDQNRTIHYRGKVFFQAPNLTLWRYDTPIQKQILADGQRVMVIEPELEQVTITKLKKNQNIFSLLQSAKKSGPNRYELDAMRKHFIITTDANGTIEKVTFKDELGNDVEIRFSHQRQNEKIGDEVFAVTIPAYYDRVER